MDRAGKFIRGLKLGSGTLSAEELVRAAWPQAVGERIAAHARPVSLRQLEDGPQLVVEVEDEIWRRQLLTMTRQILPRLWEIAGGDSVHSIEFRLGVPRRMPQRAERARSAQDEADGIQDPILRRLYRASRKRAVGG
jgi:predicted nucleic acid-binding Zn ribbon protein